MEPEARSREWNELAACHVRGLPHVAQRVFAHETVLLNVKTGRYHGLNSIGMRFLESILQAPTVADAAAVLAAEYGQPLERIQRDLAAFVDQLAERDLIELRDGT